MLGSFYKMTSAQRLDQYGVGVGTSAGGGVAVGIAGGVADGIDGGCVGGT
jgi:hypothetical protein